MRVSVNPNRVLTGNSGNLWINGKLLSQLTAVELKVTGNFEEMNFCGNNSTHSRYSGYTGEGTISMKKIDSTVLSLVGEAYQTGVMPEIKIITKLTDNVTGKSERVAVNGITITEFILAKFEAKALVEEELPIKFSQYEILELID